MVHLFPRTCVLMHCIPVQLGITVHFFKNLVRILDCKNTEFIGKYISYKLLKKTYQIISYLTTKLTINCSKLTVSIITHSERAGIKC